MRTIVPAIAIVIVLCFATQTFVNEARTNAADEERARHWRAANAAVVEAMEGRTPATQPATQPAAGDEGEESQEDRGRAASLLLD